MKAEEEHYQNKATTFQSEDEFFQAFGDAISANAATFQSEDEFFQAFGNAISADDDLEVVDDTVKVEEEQNKASTFQSEDEFFQAFGNAISANAATFHSEDEFFQAFGNAISSDDDDLEVVDDTLNPVKADKGKKMNILGPMKYSGMFYPPSVTRQAINDALEEEEEVDDED